MAKAKKLPSGSWNIRAYTHTENGVPKYESITAETKAECEWKYAQFKKQKKEQKKTPKKITVRDAVEKYIAQNVDVLSPKTLSSYEGYMKNGFLTLQAMPVKKLTQEIVQSEIQKEAKRKAAKKRTTISPKTVENEWELINSALKAIGIEFSVKLPEYQPDIFDLPSPKVVIEAIKGSDVELPCLLAMWTSLRLSEIRGLKASAVHDGFIFINQTKVYVNGKDIVKPLAKTKASKRIVEASPRIMRLIYETPAMQQFINEGIDGYIVDLPESTLRHRVYYLMHTHGLDLGLHKLRHMYASVSLTKLKIDEKTTQRGGGWSTNQTMQNIYRHTFNEELQEAANLRNDYYEKIYEDLEKGKK